MHKKNNTSTQYAAVFKSLFFIYIALVCSVSRWQGFLLKKSGHTTGHGTDVIHTRNAAGAETSLVKTALFMLFLIYIGSCFIVLFRMVTINLYKSLQPLGMQRLLFEVEITAFFAFLFLSNFLVTLSTYSIGSIEQALRAMPIPSRVFFGAKYLAHCVPAMVLSISFFGVTASVYGHYEHSPASFYVMALAGSVFFPLPVIGLCYLINICVMRSTKALKKRQFVMLITVVLGIVMALGMNYFVQSVNTLRDLPDLANTIGHYRMVTSVLTRYLVPVRYFAAALSADFSTALSSFISFIAVCVAVPAVIIGLLAGVYEKTLDGFDEHTLKRVSDSETTPLIRSGLKRHSSFITLLLREIRMMNREPAYLLHGPFAIVLLPLIYGMMYLTGSLHLPPEAAVFMQGNTGCLIAGVCGAFLGSASGVAATAVSRDAKNLRLIKSLPLSIKRYMQAKLAHTMLVDGIGAGIGVGGIAFLFSLPPVTAAAALVIALSLALFCNLCALMLDTARPKLHWDTPTAAVKHNLNTVVMFFFDILFLSATVTAAILTSLPQQTYLLWFVGIPLLASGIIAHFFWPFAEQKINKIEI